MVGGEDQVEPIVARARDELVAIRTFKAGKLLAEKATAVPDSPATILVRSGTLTCPGEGGECVFELLTAVAAAKANSTVTAPSVLHKVEPEYSKEALKAKLEGTVVLYVEVGPDGLARNLRVVRGLGSGLDEKAVEAVGQWQFQPGVKDGKPVTVAATIESISVY
jgi:TonB family protein